MGDLTRNFSMWEFRCHPVDADVPAEYHGHVKRLAKNLQVLRDVLGRGVRINSGYRTVEYNKKTGGVTNSQHLVAKAADIKVTGMVPADVKAAIEELIASGKMEEGGLGLYKNFVHYDVRGSRSRWNS